MASILHITRDYPDEIQRDKTVAVRNLIRHAQGMHNIVFSLNKTNNPMSERMIVCEENFYSFEFFSFPYGVMSKYYLCRIARRLIELITRENITLDIVHCHKLTYEGVVGYYLSRQLGIPLVCTVRGNTDLRMIKYKPTYRPLYLRTLEHAETVFFVAPWTLHKVERWFGRKINDKAVMLPNIVDLTFGDTLQYRSDSTKFITVFHLRLYKLKNLVRLIRAVDQAICAGYDISLDIVGGGSELVLERLKRIISKGRNPQRITLIGPMDHSELIPSLRQYAGLVLPSLRETFGMVYLEALHAGIPFIHSKGAGVDGYFPDRHVSISVDPKSVGSIQKAIVDLLINQGVYKENIKNLVESGGLEQFNSSRIVQKYESAILARL